jgi:hypothetical protein
MARFILLLSLLAALPAAAQPAKCPARFDEFLQRFETDMRFQVAHVRFPLPISFLDEDGRIRDRLTKLQYTKPRQPWYPTPELQAQWEVKKSVRELPPRRKVVHFEQQDAESYWVEFHFERWSSCWRLVFMDDRSS